MAVASTRLAADLTKFRRVALDSSVLIYHLEDTEPYSELTEAAFAAIAAGVPAAVVSTISVAELFVKPYIDRRPDRVAALERFFDSLPNTEVVAPGYPIAKDAARLRARYGVRLPDALLLATARLEGAHAFVTNDMALKKVRGEGFTVVVLDEYL
jgi:predicted nucleic acid-binding protein